MPIVAKIIAIIIPKRLQVIEVEIKEQGQHRKVLDERLEKIIEMTTTTQNEAEELL